MLLVPKVLAIVFHLLRVLLARVLPITRVRRTLLPRTLQTHLSVNRIGSDSAPVIIATTLVLAGDLATNSLQRMIERRLEDLLTIMAMAIVYQKLPGEVCNRFILSIGWGLLLVKLPKAMLFLAATNTRQLESPINPLHRGVE